MKKFYNVCLAVVVPLILILSAGAPVSAEGEIAVTVNSPEDVIPGSFFVCLVEIDEVTGLNAAQYDITFDTSVLELKSIDNGTVGGKTMPVLKNEIAPGHWRILQSLGLGSVEGEGYLAQLNFYAAGVGTSTITLSNALLSSIQGSEIASEWTGSCVTVVSDEDDEGQPPAVSQDDPEQPSQGDAPAGDGQTGDEQTTGNQTSPGTKMESAGEGEDQGAGAETGGDETSGDDEDTGTAGDKPKVTITYSGEEEIVVRGDGEEKLTDTVEKSRENQGDGVKWPVIWSIIGFVVIIISLVLYARIRKPLY